MKCEWCDEDVPRLKEFAGNMICEPCIEENRQEEAAYQEELHEQRKAEES